MASIHLTELTRILADRGEEDVRRGSMFLEIRFDDPTRSPGPEDPEFRNKVLTVDCPYGLVTITFDDEGLLRSLDVS
ncbi:MAG: hypothetical protein GY788_09395 [bacterium]|nr:hypothetical protein [bacterium]